MDYKLNPMNFKQTKLAFLFVWLILSTIFLSILFPPFFFSSEKIYQLVPTCEWKSKYNKECFFCGMTTGFIHISRGRFSDAQTSNALSIPLFALLVLNELGFLAFLVMFIRGQQIGSQLKLLVNNFSK